MSLPEAYLHKSLAEQISSHKFCVLFRVSCWCYVWCINFQMRLQERRWPWTPCRALQAKYASLFPQASQGPVFLFPWAPNGNKMRGILSSLCALWSISFPQSLETKAVRGDTAFGLRELQSPDGLTSFQRGSDHVGSMWVSLFKYHSVFCRISGKTVLPFSWSVSDALWKQCVFVSWWLGELSA